MQKWKQEAEALRLMEAEALRLRKRMQEAEAIPSFGSVSTTKLMLPHHWSSLFSHHWSRFP